MYISINQLGNTDLLIDIIQKPQDYLKKYLYLLTKCVKIGRNMLA